MQFQKKQGSPFGNPGVGGRPFQLSEGAAEFNTPVFGDANAMIQQAFKSGLMGLGGFEYAVSNPPSNPKPKSEPVSERPIQTPWPIWSVKPQSEARVVEV